MVVRVKGQCVKRDATGTRETRRVMQEFNPLPYDGQMLAIAAQGAAAVASGAALSCAPFAPAYRRLKLPGHALAGSDAIDLAFLSAARDFGGEGLLSANHFALGTPLPRSYPALDLQGGNVVMHGHRRAQSAADAFTFALGLSVESLKVQAQLAGDAGFDDVASAAVALGTDSASLLRALGPSPDDVLRALACLGGDVGDRQVAGPAQKASVDGEALQRHVHSAKGMGPLFVVVGAFERTHDVLSPFVRQLAPELGKLTGDKRPDALYQAADEVFAYDVETVFERVAQEEREGFLACGDAVALRCESLNPRRCDFRANAAAIALSRSRTRIVFAPDADALVQVLEAVGDQVRAVVLISEGRLPAGESARPSIVVDAATTIALDVDNALLGVREVGNTRLPTVALTVPSLGLAPEDIPENFVVETGLAPLLSTCAMARAQGALQQKAKLAYAVIPAQDMVAPTEVALRVLERMASARDR